MENYSNEVIKPPCYRYDHSSIIEFLELINCFFYNFKKIKYVLEIFIQGSQC